MRDTFNEHVRTAHILTFLALTQCLVCIGCGDVDDLDEDDFVAARVPTNSDTQALKARLSKRCNCPPQYSDLLLTPFRARLQLGLWQTPGVQTLR